MYLWGNIQMYVLSHLHDGPAGTHDQGDPKVTPLTAAMLLPIMFWCQAMFNPVGAYFQSFVHPKILLTIGSLFMLTGIFVSSFVKSWGAFVFFYGVMYPVGIGIVYYVPIICAWEWFPDHKGLVSGLIVGGYGFGSFIFGFISTALVNPDNLSSNKDKESPEYKYFPVEVADRVPHML